jgi:Spy/CpxP family protein refolding chaperone
MKRRIPCLSVLVFVITAMTAAGGPLDGMLDGKWWKNPQVARALVLSDAQVDQIEKIFLRVRPQLIDLRADLEKKRLTQNSLMENPSVKTEEASTAIDETERARSRLEKARAMMFLEIRQVLTPAQREKLIERREEIRERRQDRLRRPRPGGA